MKINKKDLVVFEKEGVQYIFVRQPDVVIKVEDIYDVVNEYDSSRGFEKKRTDL